MIEINKLSKRYGDGQDALTNINFEIGKGEMAFVTGHSGAGKSTLLKLILAIEKPSGGDLIVNGLNLNKLSRREIPYHRRKIGTVFQDHQLLTDRTVFENVLLPLEISGFLRNSRKYQDFFRNPQISLEILRNP